MIFCQTPPPEVLINCMPDLILPIPLIHAYLGGVRVLKLWRLTRPATTSDIIFAILSSFAAEFCQTSSILDATRVFVPWLNRGQRPAKMM